MKVHCYTRQNIHHWYVCNFGDYLGLSAQLGNFSWSSVSFLTTTSSFFYQTTCFHLTVMNMIMLRNNAKQGQSPPDNKPEDMLPDATTKTAPKIMYKQSCSPEDNTPDDVLMLPDTRTKTAFKVTHKQGCSPSDNYSEVGNPLISDLISHLRICALNYSSTNPSVILPSSLPDVPQETVSHDPPGKDAYEAKCAVLNTQAVRL